MTRTFVGTLGLVFAVAIILVGGYAAFNNNQTQTSEALPSPPEKQIERRATVSGQKATAGDLSWTVSRVVQRTALHTYTSPPEVQRGMFLTVYFEIKNTSDEPMTLTPDAITLVKGNTRSSSTAGLNSTFVRDDKNLLFASSGLLDPGEKKTGVVNFDLGVPFGIESPSKVSGFKLELGDGDPTSEEEHTIDLEF